MSKCGGKLVLKLNYISLNKLRNFSSPQIQGFHVVVAAKIGEFSQRWD